jgi:hypothetical protein
VLDGASDLFTAVLGERGRHTRAAFTPAQLPLGLAVELVVIAAARPRHLPVSPLSPIIKTTQEDPQHVP